MGLCQAEGHRTHTRTHTHTLSHSLRSRSFFFPPSHTHTLSTLSHMRTHTLLNISFSLSLLFLFPITPSSSLSALLPMDTVHVLFLLVRLPSLISYKRWRIFGWWPETAKEVKRTVPLPSQCHCVKHLPSLLYYQNQFQEFFAQSKVKARCHLVNFVN